MSNCPAGACSNPSAATERQLWNGGGATCNESVRLDGELRAALARNELQVYFQPQFRADTLVINGFEALLRWPHPHHGTIPPATFIPIAEQSGFIVDLGMWVLERACEHAAPLHPRPRLAVNLSPVQLGDPDLLHRLNAVLHRTGLPPSLLELEITEATRIRDMDGALANVRACKERGIAVSLDDFGKGYAGLDCLRSLPFDRIKIDQSFVQGSEHDPGARAIMEGVMVMARRLRLAVTAEGVETEQQLAIVRGEGCDEVQGNLLGRAIPGGDVQSFIRRRNRFVHEVQRFQQQAQHPPHTDPIRSGAYAFAESQAPAPAPPSTQRGDAKLP